MGRKLDPSPRLKRPENAAFREKKEENFNNVVFSAYAVKFTSKAATEIGFEKAYAAEANLKVFSEAAKGSGYVNVFPDSDGVVRKVPLIT